MVAPSWVQVPRGLVDREAAQGIRSQDSGRFGHSDYEGGLAGEGIVADAYACVHGVCESGRVVAGAKESTQASRVSSHHGPPPKKNLGSSDRD